MSRVKLSEFKERKAAEGSIEIEADDGSVFTVPPPELWSDAVAAAAAAKDNVAGCRALLGDEQYDAFVAVGGSAAVLMAIIGDEHGLTVGESSASSSS